MADDEAKAAEKKEADLAQLARWVFVLCNTFFAVALPFTWSRGTRYAEKLEVMELELKGREHYIDVIDEMRAEIDEIRERGAEREKAVRGYVEREIMACCYERQNRAKTR